MDADRFDAVLRTLSVMPSRRAAVRLVTGLGLAGLLGRDETEAKRKKKKKKKKRPTSPSPPSPPGSPPPPESPPPPPPPPPTGPGFCAASASAGAVSGSQRFAQTFLPPAGTTLTKAQVLMRINPINFSLTFQIRTVDGAGTPTSTSLGTEIVSNIPATAIADPPRLVEATFDPQVTITPGQLHALVVTATDAAGFALQNNSGNNPCPDGQRFFDSAANNTFAPGGGGFDDLVYAVTLV